MKVLLNPTPLKLCSLFGVQLHQWTYDINLAKKLQTNTSTGRSRAIRRIVIGGPSASAAMPSAAAEAPISSGGQWECLADSGWVAYDSHTAGKLAAAASAGQGTVAYSARGQKYVCNLTQMTQTNVYTKVMRHVRCVHAGTIGGGSGGGGTVFGFGGNSSGGYGGSSGSYGSSRSSGSGSGVYSSTSASPAASSCVESALPNQGFRLTYAMGGGGVDYRAVTAWQELKANVDYDPNASCPITAEPLGDGALGLSVQNSEDANLEDCFRE